MKSVIETTKSHKQNEIAVFPTSDSNVDAVTKSLWYLKFRGVLVNLKLGDSTLNNLEMPQDVVF